MYDVTLKFDPKSYEGDVKNVGLIGEFLFYKSNMTGHTDQTGMMEHDKKYVPAAYVPGLSHIGGLYYEEMVWDDESQEYIITLKLPAGVYPYGFVINGIVGEPVTDEWMSWSNFITSDGELHNFSEKTERIPDPKNMPWAPTISGPQHNSELYVGTASDYPWIPADDPAVRGTVTYVTYKDIDGKDQSLGVYLPVGYDRLKTYPVIFVTHGGGGNEADWYAQGGIHHIMDNFIAGGKTKEAIVVTMNNSVYQWDFDKISRNLIQCILPYVEKIFSVSQAVSDRAFCGLSMGSMTTLYIYMHHTEQFDYYGAFSGGIAGGEHFTLDNPRLMDVSLMIGCAEEDIAYNEREIGVPPTIRALKAREIPHIPYFVTGSHDWFCWPQMFAYFAENVLWK